MRKNILLLGAGKTATYLVEYLLQAARRAPWQLQMADKAHHAATTLLANTPHTEVLHLDVQDNEARRAALAKADLVISLLPADLHLCVAQDAAEIGIDMLTASYAKEELRALGEAFAAKGRILLMEMGLDPGIDHMVAKQLIDQVRSEGHHLHSFEAFTGAILDPSCEAENPWQYKFTWNPSQITKSGKDGAQFVQEGVFKFIPYHHVFRRIERIYIPHQGHFEGYGNRDSLFYRHRYGLSDIPTLYRGTLRPLGFCAAWNALVQLGATDSKYQIGDLEHMTHRDFCNTFLMYHPTDSVELKFAHYMRIDMHSEIMDRLKWLGLFERTPIKMQGTATAVDILQHIIAKKWTVQPMDRDKVIMWEKIHFTDAETGRLREQQAHLVCMGENAERTAIAKTVGLTLGIGARLLLDGLLHPLTGIHLPTEAKIYEPVLKELATYDITYHKQETTTAAAEQHAF